MDWPSKVLGTAKLAGRQVVAKLAGRSNIDRAKTGPLFKFYFSKNNDNENLA